MLHHPEIIARLGRNRDLFRHLFAHLPEEEARWKPAAGKWSLLEVINHLCDEEREDFRQRLALVLEDPRRPWPPIDPEGWVTARGYNRRPVAESLDDLLAERSASLRWLQTLDSPDWQATHHHPRMGPLSAEQLLASWLAHDLFHIRQAAGLHFACLTRLAAPLSLGYSGWD